MAHIMQCGKNSVHKGGGNGSFLIIILFKINDTVTINCSIMVVTVILEYFVHRQTNLWRGLPLSVQGAQAHLAHTFHHNCMY